MRLTSFRIKNFQSIYDSTDISVDDITCLVGKNESGKTAILKALTRLNPHAATERHFDVTDDYPRRQTSAYRREIENSTRKHDIVVEATFKLQSEDTLHLQEAFGPHYLSDENPRLILNTGYANTLGIHIPDADPAAVLKYLVEQANLPRDLTAELLSQPNEQAMLAALDTASVSVDTPPLAETLRHIAETGVDKYVYDQWLVKRTPTFLYFDEFYQLKGEENLNNLQQRLENEALEPPDYPLLGLLALAQVDLDDLLEPGRTETLFGILNAAANELTAQALPYWSQNRHLSLKFDVQQARPSDPDGLTSGMNFWGRIYDSKRSADTSLGSRSRGFLWFVSFLAWYSQLRSQGDNVILLLDEPGLSLHANAQADLLRYFEEELKPHNQVIYTTHSPFMVDPNHFDRVRIVQDLSIESTADDVTSDQEGTKVTQEVLDASSDSLFPLQGALGYEIHQTLFVGPNCLLVEGVSDLLFIQTVSGILQDDGKDGLRSQWTITPVGGADKVPTFIALIGAKAELNLATLIDVQAADRQRIEDLYKRKLLQKQNVHTWADFLERPEADIEDMFEPEFYLQLVNGEFGSEIKLADLQSQHPRILLRIEEHINSEPLPNGAVFNHYRPARFFAEKVKKMAKSIDDNTLQRFQKAFDAVNSLLSE